MLWLCVFVSTLPTHRTKFDPKSHPCVFVGYPYGKKGYKVLNLQTKKISVSRDLIFHEYFPFFKYTSSEKYFPSSSNHLPNMSNPSHVPPYSESTIDDVVFLILIMLLLLKIFLLILTFFILKIIPLFLLCTLSPSSIFILF